MNLMDNNKRDETKNPSKCSQMEDEMNTERRPLALLFLKFVRENKPNPGYGYQIRVASLAENAIHFRYFDFKWAYKCLRALVKKGL